ncbi:MAG TPA: peptidoglycan binding domain-containing protein, partial [Pseudomonadota bacterium]|nr:peptidoglycan binding domain-containing protein [Pseudomonadota bacterium]
MHPISHPDSEALAEPSLAVGVGGSASPPSLNPGSSTSTGAGGAPPRRSRWSLAAALGSGLLLATGVLATVSGLVLTHRNARRTVPGLLLDGEQLGELDFAALPARLHQVSERFLDRQVRLRVGRERESARWRELGLQVDEAALLGRLRELGHSGDPLVDLQSYWRGRNRGYTLQLPVSIDEKKALEFLMELKEKVDRGPIDARLDLEKHTIAPEKPGYLLRVYDSLVTLQYTARALRTGGEAKELQLAVAVSPPPVRCADLHHLVVSPVLAGW